MESDAIVFLEKALESLATAESEFAEARYNSCANRCYYACLQAAVAALLNEGIRSPGNKWGHDFVQAQFSGQLINRRKLYGGDLRTVLTDNQIVRNRADYTAEHVTAIQAGRALRKAHNFVNAVRQRS
jgi:uncharacterized protein (UPF0332 family)